MAMAMKNEAHFEKWASSVLRKDWCARMASDTDSLFVTWRISWAAHFPASESVSREPLRHKKTFFMAVEIFLMAESGSSETEAQYHERHIEAA